MTIVSFEIIKCFIAFDLQRKKQLGNSNLPFSDILILLMLLQAATLQKIVTKNLFTVSIAETQIASNF